MKIRKKRSEPTPEEMLRQSAFHQYLQDHYIALLTSSIAEDTFPYTKPLVAWRAWRLNNDGLLISAANHRTIWEPRLILPAECCPGKGIEKHSEGVSPVAGCDCGYYTVHQEKIISAAMPSAPVVWGEVYIWGKIIEHEAGYRSQYAYPRRLFVNRERVTHAPDLIARHIGQTYGVRCCARSYNEDQLLYPATVPLVTTTNTWGWVNITNRIVLRRS